MKRIFIAVTLLLIAGCGSEKTVEEKLEYEGYINNGGSYRLDSTVDGYNYYKGFIFRNNQNSAWLLHHGELNTTWTYYWKTEEVESNGCYYYFSTNSTNNKCDNVNINDLKNMRNVFNKELNNLNITLEELEDM